MKEEVKGKDLGYNKKSQFVVKETEWSFSNLELVDGHYFRGTVDRIDHHPEEDVLGIVDYKSGSSDNQKII